MSFAYTGKSSYLDLVPGCFKAGVPSQAMGELRYDLKCGEFRDQSVAARGLRESGTVPLRVVVIATTLFCTGKKHAVKYQPLRLVRLVKGLERGRRASLASRQGRIWI